MDSVVVAIDGPAASGKSSVASRLAARLGFSYVNTGAMYRAAAWAVVDGGVNPTDAGAVVAAAGAIGISFEDGRSFVRCGNRRLEAELVLEEVNAMVSRVAANPGVRERLVAMQREAARGRDVVMEGRDIGSAVFPETPYKLYIDASEEVRQRRRSGQGIVDSVAVRDRQDSARKASPLVIPQDAVVIDSSEMTLDEVVAASLGCLAEKGLVVAQGIL
jgi:cytidylate kinase